MGSRKPRGPFGCQNCGSEYFTQAKKGEGEKYCSRKCYFDAKGEARRAREPERLKKRLLRQEIQFYRRLARRIKGLRGALLRTQKVRHKREAKAKAPCRFCGRPVGYDWGRSKVFCSSECRAHMRQHRMQSDTEYAEHVKEIRRRAQRRRARTHITRAQKHGCKWVRFDVIAVLERDGWRCQMCGASTPQSLRGTYDDSAPELDHIVPISAGGEHTMENTQCLCRKCNAIKSNKDEASVLRITSKPEHRQRALI